MGNALNCIYLIHNDPKYVMICLPESGIWEQLSADLARSVATAGAGRVSESDLQREAGLSRGSSA